MFRRMSEKHNIRQAVQDYISAGYHPIEVSGKSPVDRGWQKTKPKRPELYGNSSNVGLKMGSQPDGRYLVVIDIDGQPDDLELVAPKDSWPDTLVSSSRPDHYHLVYLWPESVEKPRNGVKLKVNGNKTCLDIRSEGGQIVVWPSVHYSGTTYEWITEIEPQLLTSAIAQAIIDLQNGKTNKSRVGASKTCNTPGSDKVNNFSGGRSVVTKNKSCDSFPDSEDATSTTEAIDQQPEPETEHDISSARFHAICKKIAKSNSRNSARFEELASGCLHIPHGERDDTIYRIVFELAGHCPDASPESIASHFDTPLSFLADHAEVPFDKPVDIADKFRRAVTVRARLAREGLGLVLSPTGQPKSTLGNVVLCLEKDPSLTGRLAYNCFSARLEVLGTFPWGNPGPRQWDDRDASELAIYLAATHRLEVASQLVHEAAVTVSHRNLYHPVQEYLASSVAKWDGVPRLDSWLIDHCGATDTEYVRKISAWWLMQAVARVSNPGCQADYCLILEGEQGLGKSQALKALAGAEWFGDDLEDVGSRETAQRLAGKWLIELSELAVARKADVNRLKAFISRTTDRYRVPYGRTAEDFPRQCVFAGSTNDSEYLNDPTGARRFWPVRVSRVDIDQLRAIRDQLWAEAAVRVARGERYWPVAAEDPIFKAEVEARRSVDSWEEKILTWMSRPTGYKPDIELTTAWLLDAIFDLSMAKRSDDARISAALTSIGWTRLYGNGKWRTWSPPAPLVPVVQSGSNVVPMKRVVC